MIIIISSKLEYVPTIMSKLLGKNIKYRLQKKNSNDMSVFGILIKSFFVEVLFLLI
jgi:hypothetical protein